MQIKKKILITIIKKYEDLNSHKNIGIVKKGIKLFQNIIYISILYIYMPDMFINNSNLDDNDKMLFMACFIIFSGVMSYILQNYQCKPPGSSMESDISYNIEMHNMEITGWKRTLLRILLAFR